MTTMDEAKNALPEKILEDLKNAIREFKLNDSQKEKAIKLVIEMYKKSLYESGEAIGVVTAQSLSEPSTQMVMRTYHVAGAAQIQVTLGLPRLIEIFDARRVPKTPSMKIYLKKAYSTKDKAKKIAAEIQETLLDDVSIDPVIDLSSLEVEFPLDMSIMRERGVKIDKLPAIIKENIKDVDVRLKKEGVVVKPKKDISVAEIQKMKAKLLKVHVNGVKNIRQVIVIQEETEWVLTTMGSNLAKILEMDEVDGKRTTTNNIHETHKVLGIEAARNSVMAEAKATLRGGGLDVDIRHIMLVADAMSSDGKIKAVGRYGVAGTKGSVLARANFEETIKHLTKAAATAEIDNLESIVENVMINQVVPVGTGMFDLVFKPKKD